MSGPLLILVVDDDERMVRTLCDILRVKGHQAVAAASGEQALEQVQARRPDCVLMDVKMEGRSGIETTRMIKAVHPDLPVVLMSAFATEEQAAEARGLGVEALLVKPIDLPRLLMFLSLLRKEESILVVDDDAEFCKTLQDTLGARGMRVETEREPAQVLGRLAQAYRLLVVLGLELADTDWQEVLRGIRGKYPTKPVLLVTGSREESGGAIESGLRSGACACLDKPIQIEELTAWVEQLSRDKRRACLDGI